MSARDPKLKYQVGLDDSQAQAGFKRVKQGLKDLDKTNSQVLDSLGSAFGLNTQKIEQMTSAVRGLGQKMEQSGSAGVKAFGSLLKSITPLGGAIAGIGLGAAIAGFKALRSEAENFKGTIDGLNISMATEAYISTYKQAMHDAVSSTGESVAETEAKLTKWWTRTVTNAKNFAVNAFGGDKNGLDKSFGDVWKETRKQAEAAEQAALRNEERGRQLADIEKERLDLDLAIAKSEKEIAEYRRVAADKSKSATERAEAEAAARKLINDQAEQRKDLAQREFDINKAMGAEANNTLEETRKEVELEKQLSSIDAEREQRLVKLDSLHNSIAKSSSAAAEAAKEEEAARKRMAESQEAMKATASMLSGAPLNNLGGLRVSVPTQLIQPSEAEKELYRTTLHAYFERAGMNVHIGFEADTEKLHDITSEVQSLMGSFAETTGNAVGSLVGDLLSGGDAWGSFGNAALSAMGDMAQSVGKIAISTGIATLGIKASLESLNGWAAIAAGTALVALGAAVKAGLSNVAGGNYGASTNVASSSYSSGNSDYAGREITVKVGGTLEADGNKLIAVINNTNKRNYYTTGG